jgi:hypothetical protein
MKKRMFLGLLLTILIVPPEICPQAKPDFSGTWKQSNERSTPKRKGNVTLQIDQRDPELTVETTILRASSAPRHAVQRYTTDGKVSVSTGADGDEFHTSIIWSGQSLVFSVEEHEDGRILFSKETWTLIEKGSALQRVRERLNASAGGDEKQTLIYLREVDRSGATVPETSVAVGHLETRIEQSLTTNYARQYKFPSRLLDTFLIASVKGFRNFNAPVQVLVRNRTAQEQGRRNFYSFQPGATSVVTQSRCI